MIHEIFLHAERVEDKRGVSQVGARYALICRIRLIFVSRVFHHTPVSIHYLFLFRCLLFSDSILCVNIWSLQFCLDKSSASTLSFWIYWKKSLKGFQKYCQLPSLTLDWTKVFTYVNLTVKLILMKIWFVHKKYQIPLRKSTTAVLNIWRAGIRRILRGIKET